MSTAVDLPFFGSPAWDAAQAEEVRREADSEARRAKRSRLESAQDHGLPFAPSAESVPEPRMGPEVPETPAPPSEAVQGNSDPAEATTVEPDGFDAVNDDLARMMSASERIPSAVVDDVESSWGRKARAGKGQDFIREWVRSLSADPELRKRHMVKFAAAILATFADEKSGTVAVSMAEWADLTGVFKGDLLKARDQLLDLSWLSDTGRKDGRRKVYRLTLPTF